MLACRPRIGARTAVRHRRPLQVLHAHCLRARRQHDLLVPPVGVHPYERVAPQLLPRGRCPCRRRGAPNRGAATAPSCPRRSRPMAPPPWRSGTLPRSVWSARGMAEEVRTARCRRWRRRPEPGADGIRFTVQGMWTVNEIPSTPRPLVTIRLQSCGRDRRRYAGSERPLRRPLATGCPRSAAPRDDALLQRSSRRRSERQLPKDRRRRRSPSGSCQPERSASHVHLGQQAAPRRTATSSVAR